MTPATFHYYRGRVALHAILRGLKVSPGDEVVIQAYTCAAVVEPLQRLGLTPVFVDIDQRTYTMDLDRLPAAITDRTRAVVLQHTFGTPVDLARSTAICSAAGVPIIEDCAHVTEPDARGPVGNSGVAAFYSYEWGKPVIAGVGGMAVVHEPGLAAVMNAQYGSYMTPPRGREVMMAAQVAAHGLATRMGITWKLRSLYRRLARAGLVVGSYAASTPTPSPASSPSPSPSPTSASASASTSASSPTPASTSAAASTSASAAASSPTSAAASAFAPASASASSPASSFAATSSPASPAASAFASASSPAFSSAATSSFHGNNPEYGWRMSRTVRRRLPGRTERARNGIARRNAVAARYRSGLARQGFALPPTVTSAGPAVALVPLRMPVPVGDKARLLDAARREQIEVGDWFATAVHPLTGAELSATGYRRGSCPNAEWAAEHVITFPVRAEHKMDDVDRVLHLLSGTGAATSDVGVRVLAGPFTEGQLRAIAEMHATEVSHGFLSSLGVPVLQRLYRHAATSDHSAIFLAQAGGETVGFICGSTDTSALFREFLRRRWWATGPALIPRLLTPRRIFRALETLRYARHDAGPSDLPRAEIINFVVRPAARGTGTASSLFEHLTTWFAEQGSPTIKIVTGEQQERAHGFYTKAGAVLQGHTSIHAGASSRVYLYSLPSPFTSSAPPSSTTAPSSSASPPSVTSPSSSPASPSAVTSSSSPASPSPVTSSSFPAPSPVTSSSFPASPSPVTSPASPSTVTTHSSSASPSAVTTHSSSASPSAVTSRSFPASPSPAVSPSSSPASPSPGAAPGEAQNDSIGTAGR